MRLSAIIKPRARYLVDSKSRDFSPSPIIIIIIIPRTIERSPRVAITAASGYLIARVDCYLFSTLCLSVLRGRAGENYLVGANFFPFFFLRRTDFEVENPRVGYRGEREGEGKNDVCSDTKITSDSRATSDRLVIGHFGCLVSALFSAIFRFNFPRLV